MLDLALFGRADFVGATVASLASGLGVLALTSLVPLVIERGLGEGAVLASVVLLAWSATSVLSALGVRWLPEGVSARAQLVAGLVGCAAGQLALAGLDPESSIGRLLPGLLVCGAFNGILNAALGSQAVASVPANRAAMGSGANNTARYVGSGIGIATVTVLISSSGAAPGAAGVLSGWNVAVLLTVGFSLVGALVVLLARARGQAGALPGTPFVAAARRRSVRRRPGLALRSLTDDSPQIIPSSHVRRRQLPGLPAKGTFPDYRRRMGHSHSTLTAAPFSRTI